MNNECEQNRDTQSVIKLPSNIEIEREKDPDRKDILAAIQRILLGHPRHIPLGANSFSHLAREANVSRHLLYQRHPDLRFRYEYLRDRADQPTEKEAELKHSLDRTKSELGKLRELQSRTRQDAADWKALSDLLARGINVLQEELHQEQMKAERLARRLRKIDEQAGASSPVVLLHRRQGEETKPR